VKSRRSGVCGEEPQGVIGVELGAAVWTAATVARVKGAADKAKGAVKDAAGKIMQAEGKMDKAKGQTREALGDAKDALSLGGISPGSTTTRVGISVRGGGFRAAPLLICLRHSREPQIGGNEARRIMFLDCGAIIRGSSTWAASAAFLLPPLRHNAAPALFEPVSALDSCPPARARRLPRLRAPTRAGLFLCHADRTSAFTMLRRANREDGAYFG
jgi:uncharacterized protein YjbJ (UPF0337 family)